MHGAAFFPPDDDGACVQVVTAPGSPRPRRRHPSKVQPASQKWLSKDTWGKRALQLRGRNELPGRRFRCSPRSRIKQPRYQSLWRRFTSPLPRVFPTQNNGSRTYTYAIEDAPVPLSRSRRRLRTIENRGAVAWYRRRARHCASASAAGSIAGRFLSATALEKPKVFSARRHPRVMDLQVSCSHRWREHLARGCV